MDDSDLAARVEEELAVVRGDAERQRRYDIDGDGLVGDDEWMLVRRMIETELRARATHNRATPTAVVEPFDVDDRFTVEGLLGRGGQGLTYLASHVDGGERVALKKLHLGQVNEWKAVELFERESDALRKLQHPSIPRFVDAFVVEHDDGIAFYLAQQFIFGEDLGQTVERGGPLDEATVVALIEELADILDYLHGCKPPVVHRDIKPSNLIRSNDGRLFLVDFGAAQLASQTMGGSTVVGTSGYMPMEQYVGQATAASDLYALGATAVHLLSGRAPYDIPTDRMRLQFEPLIDVSSTLESCLRRLLEPHAEDRLATVAQLRAALRGGDPPRVVRKPSARRSNLPAATQTESRWVAIRDDQVPWLRETVDGDERTIRVALRRLESGWSFTSNVGVVRMLPDLVVIQVPFAPSSMYALVVLGCFGMVGAGFAFHSAFILSAMLATFSLCVFLAAHYLAKPPYRTIVIGDGRLSVTRGSKEVLLAPLGDVRVTHGQLVTSDSTLDICRSIPGVQGEYLRSTLSEQVERLAGRENANRALEP